MADESSSLLQTAPEFDELELEELDDSADLSTGEFIRPAAAQSSSGRISAPPPVPPEARERRSTPPNGTMRPPPPAGITIPPPPPRSGMYRIDPVGRVPALPVPATDVAALQVHLQALTRELRELRAHNDRLRLTVRLRDDRIGELEQAVREQSARAEALTAQLASVNQQKDKVADDLKRIPGIGPGFERALHEHGVTSFAQIADWTLEDVERVARHLRTAPARIVRGGWIERARELVAQSQS
jgi:predicted flap endonuclease-1-like 5' DNA nuclease